MSWLSNSLAVIDGATYVFMIDSPQPHDPRTTYRENVDPTTFRGYRGIGARHRDHYTGAHGQYCKNDGAATPRTAHPRGASVVRIQGVRGGECREIAANAKVSKPIVYEHFGGKEGLYAVIVDREMRELTNALIEALSDTKAHPRQIVERAALALLTYIEENSEGFQVLVRDSPTTDLTGSFNSLLGDISLRVEDLLTAAFKRRKLSAKGVPYYAQMLVGMTVFTGQYWAPTEGQQGAARRIHRRPRMARPEPAGFQADPAVREPEGEAARSQGRQRTSRQRAERDNGFRTSRTLLSRPPNRTNRHTCPRAPADHQNRAQAGSPKNGGTDDGLA